MKKRKSKKHIGHILTTKSGLKAHVLCAPDVSPDMIEVLSKVVELAYNQPLKYDNF
ncbi:MAG: hypothetical protein ACK41O_23385 [Runella zeae]